MDDFQIIEVTETAAEITSVENVAYLEIASVGLQGPPGPQGDPGATGATGAAGATGPAGALGPSGAGTAYAPPNGYVGMPGALSGTGTTRPMTAGDMQVGIFSTDVPIRITGANLRISSGPAAGSMRSGIANINLNTLTLGTLIADFGAESTAVAATVDNAPAAPVDLTPGVYASLFVESIGATMQAVRWLGFASPFLLDDTGSSTRTWLQDFQSSGKSAYATGGFPADLSGVVLTAVHNTGAGHRIIPVYDWINL